MKSNRKVWVLHKFLDGVLGVGKTFTFPHSGDAYVVAVTGAIIRRDPKPWRNKSERRQVLRARRIERMEAA